MLVQAGHFFSPEQVYIAEGRSSETGLGLLVLNASHGCVMTPGGTENIVLRSTPGIFFF